PWAESLNVRLEAAAVRHVTVRAVSLGEPATPVAVARSIPVEQLRSYWGGFPVAIVADRGRATVGIISATSASGMATTSAGIVPALSLASTARAQQPLDTSYTRQIRDYTSEPRFNTELTDHMVEGGRIPSPLGVLGYVPGTPGRLSHNADVNRYFRALAAASP